MANTENRTRSVSHFPVRLIATDKADRKPDPGMALCLSGGGYRAMLFHCGAIWRLYQTGVLNDLKQISSVSGGSIAAGLLALKWHKLTSRAPDRALFEREFVAPLRALAGVTIDFRSALAGLVLPGGVSARVAKAYDKHLFHGATLQDLPDEPRFVINSINVQTGSLWRFMKSYMANYRVGKVEKPTLSLARAVTASSALPPFLSPMKMNLDPKTVQPLTGADLHREPFTSNVVLSDGGVYDNLGLETAWKHYDTILVSDAGDKLRTDEYPYRNWACHSFRVLVMVDNQVRSLRKRQLIDSFRADPRDGHHRKGTYWGIRTEIVGYELADALDCPEEHTLALAALPTRLKKLPDDQQKKLVNWGYAVCDAALRRYVNSALEPQPAFPYPGGV